MITIWQPQKTLISSAAASDVDKRQGEETGLARGMGHQIREVDTEIELKADLGAVSLIGLEGLQGTSPLGRDLSKGKV